MADLYCVKGELATLQCSVFNIQFLRKPATLIKGSFFWGGGGILKCVIQCVIH
jgi:hypothetical protein